MMDPLLQVLQDLVEGEEKSNVSKIVYFKINNKDVKITNKKANYTSIGFSSCLILSIYI